MERMNHTKQQLIQKKNNESCEWLHLMLFPIQHWSAFILVVNKQIQNVEVHIRNSGYKPICIFYNHIEYES